MVLLYIGSEVLIWNKNFGMPHKVLAIDGRLLLLVVFLTAYFFFRRFRCYFVHIIVTLMTIILQSRSSFQILFQYYHVIIDVCWSGS